MFHDSQRDVDDQAEYGGLDASRYNADLDELCERKLALALLQRHESLVSTVAVVLASRVSRLILQKRKRLECISKTPLAAIERGFLAG